MSEIDQLMLEGKTLSAHRELSRLYWSHPVYRDAFAKRIEQTAQTIYFSPQPHFMQPYRVQPGDQLRRVAKLYNVPWEYIEKLNRIALARRGDEDHAADVMPHVDLILTRADGLDENPIVARLA